MFACFMFSDKEKQILKNASEETIKKTIEEAKADGYSVKEATRIKNKNREVSAVIYKAVKKPKYIWE